MTCQRGNDLINIHLWYKKFITREWKSYYTVPCFLQTIICKWICSKYKILILKISWCILGSIFLKNGDIISWDMLRPITSCSTANLISKTDERPLLWCSQFSKLVLWPILQSAYSFKPAPHRTGLMVSSTISALQCGLRQVLKKLMGQSQKIVYALIGSEWTVWWKKLNPTEILMWQSH